MPTNVVMPQMGESVAEGTVVRWIKKVGESVDRDEPLFEISTDKVDAEIPSPAAGVVLEIRVHEGDTVPIDTVVAVIGEADGQERTGAQEHRNTGTQEGRNAGESDKPPTAAPTPLSTVGPTSPATVGPALQDTGTQETGRQEAGGQDLTEARRRQKSSPLVRRIAEEHHVDIAHVQGSGISGRVTKHDILTYIDDRRHVPAAPAGRTR